MISYPSLVAVRVNVRVRPGKSNSNLLGVGKDLLTSSFAPFGRSGRVIEAWINKCYVRTHSLESPYHVFRLAKPLQGLRCIWAVSLRKFGVSLRKLPQKTICIMKHPNCVLSYNSSHRYCHTSSITVLDHLDLLPWLEPSRLLVNPLVGKLPGKAGNSNCYRSLTFLYQGSSWQPRLQGNLPLPLEV